MLALLLSLTTLAAANAPRPSLAHAKALLGNFDDDAAAAELRQLLATHPPAPVAAQAHLYLGLVAINQLRTDGAVKEFEEAIRRDLGIDLPPVVPPLAHRAFERARDVVLREVARQPAAPPIIVEAPAAPPLAVEKPAPRVRSRLPAWVLFGVGGGALAAGVVFGVLDSSAVSQGRNGGTGGLSVNQIASLQSQAQTDAVVADVCFGAAAAAAVVGTVLFFTAGSGHAQIAALPLPGGAAAAVSGSF